MEATKYAIETLENLPLVIENYVINIPAEIMDKKRNESTWTIREHIYHIADVQIVLLNRIKLIVSEDNPIIEPYFPDQDVMNGFKFSETCEAIASYKKYRNEQIQILRTTPVSDFRKQVNHKEYSEYSLTILINHMIFHEYWHMYRIEEIWLIKEKFFV
jgi:uncharacterized damage-inducible protein DinB